MAKNNTDKLIPNGLFFNQIIAPNYSFEILSWLIFTILFKTITGAFFTLCTYWILSRWAAAKRK